MRGTCRPSGAKCVTTCRPSGACGTICGAVSIVGRVLLAQRVGEPNPYAKYNLRRAPRSSFRAGWGTQPLRIQLRVLRPSGAPVAPLGLNAAQFAARYPSWGEVSSPSGLGDPTPTGSTVCDNTTLRSSGARRLDVSRCYRHVAPLGLGRSGLGNPTPTDPTCVLTFQFSCLPVHLSPLWG